MTPSLEVFRRLCGWLILTCAAALVGRAAEPVRTFDLPAGQAVQTLKRFAVQAGREIVFSSAAVSGVVTQPVQGTLTAREALDQMLRETGLVASQERKSGAFAVRRGDSAPKKTEAPALATARGPFRPAAGETGTITGRVRNLVTGQYLQRARVAVRGTNRVAYADDTGAFRLVGVPAGLVVLEVFYTDLDAAQETVEVPAGGNVTQLVELSSVARYGPNPAVVKLDPFVLAADKEADASALATNEQRFAPNLRNVMSTDSLGDVLGSNVGEFLKFIPGLSAEYSSSEIVGINIRGLTGDMTTFSADGVPQVNANSTPNRAFNMMAMALNDIARIEVTKAPLPSMPADSLAGSVNLLSKSAFDRSRAQLRFGLNFTGNSENLYLKPQPDSNADANRYKIIPGATFDYTLPVGRDFGIVVTGMQSTNVNEQNFSTTTYSTGGTSTGASLERPYLLAHAQGDGPSRFTKRTLRLKADWRVTPDSVLSVGYQFNDFKSSIGSLNMNSSVGATGTPTVPGGVALSFGPDYALGATGRGSVNISGSGQSYVLRTRGANVNYRFDNGPWLVETLFSVSTSRRQRRDSEEGHFTGLNTALVEPARIAFLQVTPTGPGQIRGFDNTDRELNLFDIANYRITTGTEGPYRNNAGGRTANFNLRRRLDQFSFPLAVQAGAAHRIQLLDTRLESKVWTYNGPDGNPNTIEPAAPYLMQVYNNQIPFFGDRLIPWVSPRRAYAAWQANPALFSQTEAQQVASENLRRLNSEWLKESVTAWYAQMETSGWHNRLRLLTGVRFEQTTDRGEGSVNDPTAVFARNADGSYARDAAGQRIRRPEAGTAGSMEQLNLTLRERAHHVERSYDGWYPSLHLTCELRPGLLGRVAYARTYGRPNFNNIIPRSTITENNLGFEDLDNPAVVKGTVTVRNPSLRPWTANNYDAALEYYSEQGGIVSAGIFVKEIANFFGAAVRPATADILEEVGLDQRYLGWNVSTQFNAGSARISGVEFNARQSLRQLGRWGRFFTVFGNGTYLRLEGHQQASFTSFIPRTANWGGSFAWKKLNLVARWNYRGLNRGAARLQFGEDGFLYVDRRTTLDVSLSCQLTRRLSLEASAVNLTNVGTRTLTYGSATPGYARQFQIADWGASLGVGLSGTF